MRVTVRKSTVCGEADAPPSKSHTIRGLICAALAYGESRLVRPLAADDTLAAANVLRALGAVIREEGGDWLIAGGGLRAPGEDLFCGDSAATLRFLAAVCAGIPGRCRLTAGPSLALRPVGQLTSALSALGATVTDRNGLPPVTVGGGSLPGGSAELPGDVSSQFLSGLLIGAPLAKGAVTVRLTTPLESADYVLMTRDVMARFGVTVAAAPGSYTVSPQEYRPASLAVEGDWSSASYLLALGAMAGSVRVGGLDIGSTQGDHRLLDILRDMGAAIAADGDGIAVTARGLRAVTVDLTDIIDLLPTLAALGAAAEGQSVFTGIRRARLKESDRVAAVTEGLAAMGISVSVEEDTMRITGGQPRGAVIDSKGDHRIAMAFSLLGAVAGDTVITGAECVGKTFPDYWDILEQIGGEVEIDE